MSNVMTISKRTASGLEEVLRTLLLDSENKVPADRLRIVGALSDGNIIEDGSNTNGYWVRFADGTQVCLGSVTFSAALSRGDMYVSISPTQSWTYPAAFVSNLVAGYCGGWYKQNVGEGWAQTRARSSHMTFRICNSFDITETEFSVVVAAIGKWK